MMGGKDPSLLDAFDRLRKFVRDEGGSEEEEGGMPLEGAPPQDGPPMPMEPEGGAHSCPTCGQPMP